MFKGNTREFQAGLNPEDLRRHRQNNSLSLRRQDRETRLQKKRQRILHSKHSPKSKQEEDAPPNAPVNHQRNEKNNPILNEYNLSRLTQGVMSQHPGSQFECVKQFREMLSKKEQPPIK